MKCTTETLTQEHNVVLHCQSGDDCLSFLVPEVSDGVHTVLILNFVECCVVHHTHVHEPEQQGNLVVIVTGDEDVAGHEKISSCHSII